MLLKYIYYNIQLDILLVYLSFHHFITWLQLLKFNFSFFGCLSVFAISLMSINESKNRLEVENVYYCKHLFQWIFFVFLFYFFEQNDCLISFSLYCCRKTLDVFECDVIKSICQTYFTHVLVKFYFIIFLLLAFVVVVIFSFLFH